ncbi:MAG: hypothetical protein GX557_03195 [Chloroflexi bacterium]|nr:hypothetical protein [Chloroflexota bacterium]
MSAKRDRSVGRWMPAAVGLALALGTALGLVLAWQVWPVRWYNTDPADLRVEHQMEYVITAADSLAISGDAKLARQRLDRLVDQDTSLAQVANLVERVAQEQERDGDQASAVRIRQLAELAELPSASAASFDAPMRNVGEVLSRLGLVVVVALAVLGALAIAMFVARRGARNGNGSEPSAPAPIEAPSGASRPAWGTPKAREQSGDWAYAEAVPDRSKPAPTSTLAPRPYTETPRVPPREVPRDTVAEAEVEELAAADETEPDAELWEPVDAEPTTPATQAADEAEQDEPRAALPFGLGRRRPEEPEPMVAAQARLGALGTFEAEYSYGQDDFDCSFSIESTDGSFYGECGIGIAGVLSADGAQKVDAFELWLFDKGDIRTVAKILVSPYVEQDDALTASLSAKGELVPAQEGLVVELETLSLRVTATLAHCQFAEDAGRPEAYFTALSVGLLVDLAEGEAD